MCGIPHKCVEFRNRDFPKFHTFQEMCGIFKILRDLFWAGCAAVAPRFHDHDQKFQKSTDFSLTFRNVWKNMCGIPHKMCGINVWNSTQNVWNKCVEFCPRKCVENGIVWHSGSIQATFVATDILCEALSEHRTLNILDGAPWLRGPSVPVLQPTTPGEKSYDLQTFQQFGWRDLELRS